MSYQSRQTNNRVTAAPECGPASDIVELAAAAAGADLMAAVRSEYGANDLAEGDISGIVISPSADCTLRTATTGAAGTGIKVAAGERFYIPYPGNQKATLLYDCADVVYAWVLH